MFLRPWDWDPEEEAGLPDWSQELDPGLRLVGLHPLGSYM